MFCFFLSLHLSLSLSSSSSFFFFFQFSWAPGISHEQIFSQTTGATSGAIVSLSVEPDGSTSPSKTLYLSENSQPTSLSTDIWDKVLFWGTKDGRLFKGDVAGNSDAQEAQLSEMSEWTNPRGIAAAHAVKNVYWTFYDSNSGYVHAARKGYDTDASVTLLNDDVGLPDGTNFGPAIEIDDKTGMLYWCWNDQILRAPLNSDGSIDKGAIDTLALFESELAPFEVVDINISDDDLYFAMHNEPTGETGLYYVPIDTVNNPDGSSPVRIHRFFTASTQTAVTVDIDPIAQKLILVANLVEGRVYWWPLESDGSVKPGVPTELEGISGMTDVAVFYTEFPTVLVLVGITAVVLLTYVFVVPYLCPGIFNICRSSRAPQDDAGRDPQDMEDDLLLDEPERTTVFGRVSRTASTVSDRLKENFYLIRSGSMFGRSEKSADGAGDDDYKPLD